MTELARGSISDRPWGWTFGALGLRGLTGQLALSADGKQYVVAFSQGAVVGATSPLVNDAAVRVAMTANLVSPTQVADITRRLAASAGRDEVQIIAETAKLSPENALRLRRRVIAQRAARTFAFERGDFVIDDQITLPVFEGTELDVRAIVYLGVRTNMGEDRLALECQQMGAWFKLKTDAIPDLAQYGFTENEKPVLERLVRGANLADLVGDPQLDARTTRTIVYTLASCGACEREEQARPTAPPRARRPSEAPTELRPGGIAPENVPTQPRSSTRTHAPSVSPGIPVSRTPTASSGTFRAVNPDARARPPTPSSAGIAVPSNGNGGPSTQRTPTPNSGGVPVAQRTPTPNSSGIPRSSGSFTVPRTTTRDGSGAHPAISRAGSGSHSGQYSAVDPERAASPSTPPPTRTGNTIPPPMRSGSSSVAPATVSRTGTRPGSGSVAPATVSNASRPTRPRSTTAAAAETERLIDELVPLLDRGADHFAILGVPAEAAPDVVRAAYFNLARKLHPDRLAALGIHDPNRNAQRLFAQINAAFGVLSDPARRAEYVAVLRRGSAASIKVEDDKAQDMAVKVMRAEEAFRQGEMAMRREQLAQAIASFALAVELSPHEPEYAAMLAWAKFAAAPDKNAVAGATRTALQKAAEDAPMSPTGHFFLGRVERMLGREKQALAHFQEVLMIKPGHSEASSEVRILEQRLRNRR